MSLRRRLVPLALAAAVAAAPPTATPPATPTLPDALRPAGG